MSLRLTSDHEINRDLSTFTVGNYFKMLEV